MKGDKTISIPVRKEGNETEKKEDGRERGKVKLRFLRTLARCWLPEREVKRFVQVKTEFRNWLKSGQTDRQKMHLSLIHI